MSCPSSNHYQVLIIRQCEESLRIQLSIRNNDKNIDMLLIMNMTQ